MFKTKITPLSILTFSIIVFFGLAKTAFAASPVLNFSDLTSGPATGLGDGHGSGAIVTIWGNNLGTPTVTNGVPQGNYHVYVGSGSNWVEASYVYEWTNATQHAGHPSDLYTYHKMQVIMFSLGAGTPSGNQQIKVVVDGVESTTLPFTVRSGNIYFVKITGSDTTGNGSWANPWRTIKHFANSSGLSGITPGTILYAGDGIADGQVIYSGRNGTADTPFAVAAYPGAVVSISGQVSFDQHQSLAFGADYVYQGSYHERPEPYWIWSKITLKTVHACANGIPFARLIGMECTQISGQGWRDGYDGVWQYVADGTTIYGVYTHDIGLNQVYSSNCSAQDCPVIGAHNAGDPYPEDMASQDHTWYLQTYRDGAEIAPFDFGWNILKNCGTYSGIHFYDENCGGSYSGTVKIHDNVVVNQRGNGINVVPGGRYNAPGADCSGCPAGHCGNFTNTFDVFNNLIINSGRGPQNSNGYGYAGLWKLGMAIGHHVPCDEYHWDACSDNATFNVYNNTIYGYGGDPDIAPGLTCNTYQGLQCGAISAGRKFGVMNIRNNLIVDTKNQGLFWWDGYDLATPNSSSHNLWWSTGNTETPPGWDNSPRYADPLLVNPGANNFTPQSGSPVRDSGYNASALLTRDLFSVSRPQGTAYDIGAFEYDEGGLGGDTTAPGVPSGLSVR